MKLLSTEPYSATKASFLSAAAWLMVATSFGLTGATELVAPDLIKIPWLLFGRVRPVHTTLVMFGFIGTTYLGAVFYVVPRLMRAPLFSERLAHLTLWAWNLALVAGVITLLTGHTQSREYAELIWPLDIAVLAVLALTTVNALETIRRRTENLIYVTVWYLVAGLIITWVNYAVGNAIWHPSTGSVSGILDAILAWFYGHNVLGLFLTPFAVGMAYYILPRVSGRPLYSHTLSLVGFWSLVALYTHIGSHHLLQSPIPTWLKVLGIVDSLGMIIPVIVALTNLWLTMKGRLGALHDSVGGRFVMAGTIWYFIVGIQGPVQALPTVQRVTHFSNWVVAHAHIGVLGFSAMIAMGTIYFLIPEITGRKLYSDKLADVHYWLTLFGVTSFFMVLTAAGLVQGNAWLNGETVYRMLPQLNVYMILRGLTGISIVLGAFIGFYNIFMSLTGRGAKEL